MTPKEVGKPVRPSAPASFFYCGPSEHPLQARLGLAFFHNGADVAQPSFAPPVQQQRLAQPKSFLNVATVMCGQPKFT